ncbi:DUF397 domain-containing protein [Amycolatopsis sp. NPDC101161]|uniref:DUF397 domain-containing protein n=1 Tax=Amycolatopsis sp. NPDC101161 TaxID=3363940 RepID=UPI003814E441
MTTKPIPSTSSRRGGWFKSRYSNAGGSCVEVRFKTGATLASRPSSGHFGH